MVRVIPLPRGTSFVVVFQIPHQAFDVCLAQCCVFFCIYRGEAKLVVVVCRNYMWLKIDVEHRIVTLIRGLAVFVQHRYIHKDHAIITHTQHTEKYTYIFLSSQSAGPQELPQTPMRPLSASVGSPMP